VFDPRAGRDSIIARRNGFFQDGKPFVCLPTPVGPAPPLGQAVSDRHTLRLRNSALTSVAGNTGRPQISLPLCEVGGLPIGLSLLGDYNSDEQLIAIAREISRT